MAEKARTLYKKADGAGLAVLIFEAMLLGSAERTTESKDDDPLTIAATLFKIDTGLSAPASLKKPRRKRGRKLKRTQTN